MSDYATMTDEQLNAEVARRRGQKVVHVDNDDLRRFVNGRGWLWDFVELPNGECEEIPQVATSIDAAAALDFGERRLSIHIEPTGLVLVAYDPVNYIRDTSESRARTIAWLLYMDAVGEGMK